jgi:hypothetical protein
MERTIFYNTNFEIIAKVDNSAEMDWVTVFEQLTTEEFEAVRTAYIVFCNGTIKDDDIKNNYDFEEYLLDDALAEGAFYEIIEVEEEEKIGEREGLTIRQLYEMAEKVNALDIPINWNFTCSDDWYSQSKMPLTIDEVTISKNTVDFYL